MVLLQNNYIDGIEYYQTELDLKGQTKLINFVLKSRLSQSANLKLNTKKKEKKRL